VVSADRYEAERLQGKLIAAGKEDVWGWSGRAGRIRAARRAEFLVREAGLGPGVRCLELGCGTGEFTERLVASGCDLVAVDLSEETAALARERVGDRARVVVGNVETGEGLEGLELDAIVGVSVLHHVDLDATFAHTFTLLRPEGRFAFSEPNMANPQVWAERNLEPVRRLRHVTPHETAFRADELRRRFESAGLVVEVSEPFEFLHPRTPAWLVPAALSLERGLEATPARGIAGSLRIAGRRPAD
jgi:SAM-dependent methyltransferase